MKFVAAFDVDAKKVGFDLSEAIFASENNTIKIADAADECSGAARPDSTASAKYYADTIELSDEKPVDVVKVPRTTRSTSWCPTFRWAPEEADKFYAQCAIDAGVAFVNALPVFIASDPVWAEVRRRRRADRRRRHQEPGRRHHHPPRDGQAFEDRGVTLDRTYQLNVGGNMDFKNMLERERLESKKVSKTQAVTST